MSGRRVENITAVIAFVEAHLCEELDLDQVAGALGYSKYHLHRMFTQTVGITLHDYIRRRRLTEAAKLLVFTQRPVVDIALLTGYASQQAFAVVFKSMYKKTPVRYRRDGAFYPLQLAFTLRKDPSPPKALAGNISYAGLGDLSGWREFISLVVDGFPCLETTSHMERVREYIRQGQAIIARDGPVIIGAAAFSRQTGSIDFLAVHPQYRRQGVERALLDFMMGEVFSGREVSITTFREGDRADPGQREAYRSLGFAEGELLTEFGYPTQRLVLKPERGRDGDGA